ncbi:hypothetical protein [Candidatus Nitronereus thalassa]|uniref:Killing trait n=1 Tax=Candidatus Nitronereus thalassa TaxID=3020898 RepID=A0ABU3KB21_9BACT|nr:hypothetical protein [Candidatus Nitronereus thalassa]MDT7043609.1 hypothetical protein [Candidatus Nitronereus thalassa]
MASENTLKEGTAMGLGAIAQNVSTAINGLIVNSVFQNSRSQATPIEQNQLGQTDSVSISSKARELSSKSK